MPTHGFENDVKAEGTKLAVVYGTARACLRMM